MPGRHRHLRSTGLVATTAALAVAVVAGGAWAGYRQVGGSHCAATESIKVAAATEIAPAVQAAAGAWSTRYGTCVTVAVLATEPTAMAAAIGSRHGVTLAGVGGSGQAATGIDVWVPDSSTWLLRLASEAPGFAPSNLGSVAQSPIVLAVPEPSA